MILFSVQLTKEKWQTAGTNEIVEKGGHVQVDYAKERESRERFRFA